MPSYKPVAAVSRAFAVLRAVSVLRGATVNAIHAETNINKATIIRMLETLQSAGFVVRDDAGSTYFVSGKTLELSIGFERLRELAMAAQPTLDRLRQQMMWPANVAIFDLDSMIIAASSPGSGRLFLNDPPGFRLPLLATALGRAYIAYAPEDEREAALARLKSSPDPWNEYARDPELCEVLMTQVRRLGYATIDERFAARAGFRSLIAYGVPIMNGTKPAGALNAAVLREASDSDTPRCLVARLNEAAEEISIKLRGV